VTALPPLAAYHDLRWLFASGQSWFAFIGVLLGVLVVRAAIDAAFVLLAWPDQDQVPRPGFGSAFRSCAVLTVLVWVLLSPVVTLMFGVALVPFSWPFLGALPILLGTALALSHGGVHTSWWRRLPATGTVVWLLAGFVVLSGAAAALPHLNTGEYLGVAVLAGLVNARAWYGVTASAVRHARLEPPTLPWRAMLWQAKRALARRTSWLPLAPVAAVLVVGLVIGLARLTFTGTVHLTPTAGHLAAGAVVGASAVAASQSATAALHQPIRAAVMVVAGWGSNCCRDADALRDAEPGMLVQQFSYLGLTPAGHPIAYHRAKDLPIQELGDRMAAQVQWLHAHTRAPVDVVAESEGTLGLYAMLARHPGLPVQSVVLLSPIVEPGQFGRAGVPGEALITLNNLIGKMSPYGAAGAQELIDSVSEFGAAYFKAIQQDRNLRWLAVVPLADAVTMPLCPYPPDVVVVQAFHGGLLGHAQVRQTVEEFLDGNAAVRPDRDLMAAAKMISAAAAAWRMPDLHPACP
jgi:hypothetical protein